MQFAETFRTTAASFATIADTLDEEDMNTTALALAQAGHVMVYGCGREGLMMRGFAMQLAQLGRPVSVQGDMTAPRLGPRDIFMVSAGAGAQPTVSALCRAARAAGAEVIYLTADPSKMPAGLANLTLILPERTADAGQSPYEGRLFLFLEVLARRLMALCEETAETMGARRTNME